MSKSFVSSIEIQDFSLWDKIKGKRALFSFDLETTARCDNDCRHCYINLPAGDRAAREQEFSVEEIGNIADQAVSLGAVWCLITGGEPLLRKDFTDIYLLLKRKGFWSPFSPPLPWSPRSTLNFSTNTRPGTLR